MIYDYQCLKCGEITEAIRSVDERNNCPECEVCGGETKKIISAYNVHGDLEPYLDEHIGREPVWIKSRKHREKVMKEEGVSEAYGKGWR